MTKNANIEFSKLWMEFERKQREQEEQMMQFERELQVGLNEAELESSLWSADKFQQSRKTEFEEKKSSKVW